MKRHNVRRQVAVGLFASAALAAGLFTSAAVRAQPPLSSADVTFSRDIAPILQRSCQECHHADGAAPMSLMTYEEARPWARSIKARTALRSLRGAMPPWFAERNIGIQKFNNDVSLSDDEVAMIASGADSGAHEYRRRSIRVPPQDVQQPRARRQECRSRRR